MRNLFHFLRSSEKKESSYSISWIHTLYQVPLCYPLSSSSWAILWRFTGGVRESHLVKQFLYNYVWVLHFFINFLLSRYGLDIIWKVCFCFFFLFFFFVRGQNSFTVPTLDGRLIGWTLHVCLSVDLWTAWKLWAVFIVLSDCRIGY